MSRRGEADNMIGVIIGIVIILAIAVPTLLIARGPTQNVDDAGTHYTSCSFGGDIAAEEGRCFPDDQCRETIEDQPGTVPKDGFVWEQFAAASYLCTEEENPVCCLKRKVAGYVPPDDPGDGSDPADLGEYRPTITVQPAGDQDISPVGVPSVGDKIHFIIDPPLPLSSTTNIAVSVLEPDGRLYENLPVASAGRVTLVRFELEGTYTMTITVDGVSVVTHDFEVALQS